MQSPSRWRCLRRRMIGIHTNMPATVPDDIADALTGQRAAIRSLADEQNAYNQLDFFYKNGLGYAQEMANRPQTLYGIIDSPVGLAGCNSRSRHAQPSAHRTCVQWRIHQPHARDDILDNITLYWVTNTAISSARLYWENKLQFFQPKKVSIPVAVSVFPDAKYPVTVTVGSTCRLSRTTAVCCSRRSCKVPALAKWK